MEKSIGNMETIVADKEVLISTLKANKEKHDAIFQAALSGYWAEVNHELKEKESQFKNSVEDLSIRFEKAFAKSWDEVGKQEKISSLEFSPNLKNFSTSISAQYPENHSYDYIVAIKKIELNSYDKIELTSNEFNNFIMNDWSWKSSFLNSSNKSISFFTGSLGTGCIDSSWYNQAISGYSAF